MSNDEQRQEEHDEAEPTGEKVRPPLEGRPFSLAEALGRAGGGLLRGASPVPRRRQAELATRHYLERRLHDSEGALGAVLCRRATGSSHLLASGWSDPFGALGATIEGLLASPEILRRFVAEVDAEWGRISLERPYFEREGQPSHPEDPYTVAGVRSSLSELLDVLREDLTSRPAID